MKSESRKLDNMSLHTFLEGYETSLKIRWEEVWSKFLLPRILRTLASVARIWISFPVFYHHPGLALNIANI